jgi:hypothetical protein
MTQVVKRVESANISQHLPKYRHFSLSLSGFSATTILRKQSDGEREETERSNIKKNNEHKKHKQNTRTQGITFYL